MSIGTLGSAGDQFRDFLSGGQKDIGQGLQSVLSNYANPDGNFIRLADRSRNMFQLTSSEYQKVYDQDAQNQFAETWYAEYRAILLLRAEALKKKLNRSYNKVLENAIYAPVRPGEAWAPEANRDQNDISADNPLEFYSGGTVKGPPPPTSTELPPDDFIHPAWFSGTAKYSSGNAYDDLRRYINAKYPLDDLDGDGEVVKYNPGPGPAGSDAPNDGGYNVNGENNSMDGSNYYNLWKVDALPGGEQIYGLGSPSGSWWQEIEREMNIPPSTTTQNFLAYDTNTSEDNYYIEIPPTMTSENATIFALLPTFVQTNATGTGKFTLTQKGTLVTTHKVPATAFKDIGGGFYALDAGTKFYDPVAIPTQALFTSGGSYGDNGAGAIGGITLNPMLVGPPGINITQQDVSSGGGPPYQAGFIDSWMEARALQKREAQIEAAYRAYANGNAKIGGKLTYEEVMDQVFTALDQVGGSGGPMPPGAPPPLPAGTPTSGNNIGGMMPYGYYYEPDGGGGFKLSHPGLDPNPVYGVGVEFNTPSDTDANSVYNLIYQRLALAADPTSIPGGDSGSAAFSGTLPPPVPTPTPAPTPAGTRQPVGGSNLYTPIPVGAAESNPDGQPNINNANGVEDLDDTTHTNPGYANTVAEISKLFVGRQWDYAAGYDQGTESTVAGTTDIAPVKYDASTISVHLMVLPGWWYDASGTGIGTRIVTLSPPIEGFAWQTAASLGGLGRIDDVSNTILGGPFFQVGGGADSLGLGPDLDGSPVTYSFPGTGAGVGIGGIYWGHTSAVGTIGRVEELMDNSGEDVAPHSGNSAGPAFDIMKASLGVLAGLGGGNVQEMSLFPNVGLAGFHFDANIPIPIPIPPAGVFFLNIPMTVYGSTSYDIMTHLLYEYLDGMKHEVIDSLSAYSYATSGGYAMDSYGMRGEYHFTEKTAYNSLDKMPDLLGLVNVASIIESAVGLIGLNDYTINNYSLNDEGIFDGDRRHSFSAAEAREMDTGAFFSAAAFLSQFQLNNLEYSYWTSTHQNEEAANMDVLRLMALTGKELMKVLNKTVFGIAGRVEVDGFLAAIPAAVLNFMLAGYQQSLNEALMWDLLLHDQDETGFVTSSKIRSSSLKAEGYDFIEDERKLFAFDYEQTAKKGVLGSAVSSLFGSFETPNQVLNGMANTRRYKPYLAGVDGRAGRQGYGGAIAGQMDPSLGSPPTPAAATGPNGENLRVHPLGRHATDPTKYDDNWDIEVGFWQDTGLGDINEVYVRKNRVRINGAVQNGLSGANVSVTTEIDRFVGSHNRLIGRGYDGAAPLNLQSFRTGYFASKYFGHYISEADPRVISNSVPDGGTPDQVTYNIDGTIDGHSNVQITMHGGEKYYDRKNDYSFSVTAGTTVLNLSADAALAPVFGGRLKIATVDQNDPNDALGASTMGETNELTKTLYEYMRVKADGSNAQLVKQYRDVFNIGLLDDIFISSSANAATGGGVTSSIRIKFRAVQDDLNSPFNLGTGYEDRRSKEIVGSSTVIRTDGTSVTQNLMVEPGYLGQRDMFKNTNRGMADIFLSSFFAFKRQPKTKAQ